MLEACSDIEGKGRDLLTIPYEKLQLPAVIQAAIKALYQTGFILIKDVSTEDRSEDTCSLLSVATKFGTIMRTWYGNNTFFVKASVDAKNIANTPQALDLHMDLLHFQSPPRYQLLHCLHRDPSVQGGASYFVDAFKAAETLKYQDKDAFDTLCKEKVGFEYKNDGHWTYAERPTIELHSENRGQLSSINYSPPFQAPTRLHPVDRSHEDPTERIRKFSQRTHKILENPL